MIEQTMADKLCPPAAGPARTLASGLRKLRGAAAGIACASLTLAACATNRASMMPQPRQPEPTRSAADGEIIGANRQTPGDTLEASVTNAHPAPGWEMENGKLVRSTEVQNPSNPEAVNREEVQKTAGEIKPERDCIADSQQQAKSAKAAKANAEGQETAPAPRALDRSLQGGCPHPPKDR